MFALDPIMERFDIKDIFKLRQVCKQGKEKMDRVMFGGIVAKKSKHIIRTHMHLYILEIDFFRYRFEIDWTCYPWTSDVHFTCVEKCPESVIRCISLALYPAPNRNHNYGDLITFPVTAMQKAFPEFRKFYGEQLVCNKSDIK